MIPRRPSALGWLALCLSGAPAAEAGESGPLYMAANASRVAMADFASLGAGSGTDSEETQIATAFARFSPGSATIDLGLDYQYTHYDYVEVDSRDRDLHRLQFPARISMPGGRWHLEGHVAPGIFTSSNVLGDFFSRGSRDDLFVSARLEARSADPAGPWILGIAHDRSFGRSMTYPVLGARLSPEDTLDVRLAWPDPEVRYTPSDRHSLSLSVFPAGNQWHVRTDDFTSEWDYRFEAWQGRLSWSGRFLGSLTLDVSVGYEFDRMHHFTDDTGARIDAAVDDAWVAAIGFRLGGAPLPLPHGAHLNR